MLPKHIDNNEVSANPQSATSGTGIPSRWEWLVLGPLVLVILLFVFLNLGDYPTINGWDEGMYLQTAKNLARYGEYATRNGQIFERLTPPGGTGPTLIAPVALALWVSGGSLVAARLVIVAYLLTALAGVYVLVRDMGGWLAAVISLLLFLTAGYATYDTLWVGRQVLAEIPAMAFLLLGLWMWIKSWRKGIGWLAASAVLLALAVVSKNQIIFVLGLAFVLFWLANRFHYQQLRDYYSFIPMAGIALGYGVWFVISLWIVGPVHRSSYLIAQQALTSATFLHVSPQRWLDNLKLFYHSGQCLTALAGLGYGLYRTRGRTLTDLRNLVLPLFGGVTLANFIGLSVPWARYLYPALALAALCTALLIVDFAGWFIAHGKPVSGGVMIVLVLCIVVGPRLFQGAQRILTTHDASPERFAALVDQRVPDGEPVLSWEWELEFYTSHVFTHPPSRLFAAMVDRVYSGGNDPLLEQSRIPTGIEYVIVGPFANQTQLFTDALALRSHYLIAHEGPYSLYQLQREDPLPGEIVGPGNSNCGPELQADECGSGK